MAPSLTYAQLIQRVRRATAKRGKKAELARWLNVPDSRIAEWLRTKNQIVPRADTALRLLAWVEQEEGKQKSPGSASTPPERKTRKGSSKKNETNPSGQS